MIVIIITYLIIGLIFDYVLMTEYKIKKRTVPMWIVHGQLIGGWLPILIYSACDPTNHEDELEQTLNQSIKDSGLIHSHAVMEMPGKDEDK